MEQDKEEVLGINCKEEPLLLQWKIDFLLRYILGLKGELVVRVLTWYIPSPRFDRQHWVIWRDKLWKEKPWRSLPFLD